MANDNNNNAMLGEISTIRNILMGEQMSQYENRFAEMQTALEKAQEELGNELRATASGTDDRLTNLERDMNARFDKLEKMLSDSVAQMNTRMDKISTADKKQLGEMLATLSQKLIGK